MMAGRPGPDGAAEDRFATASAGQEESLFGELQATADAGVGHLRQLVATAAAEAQLSMASAVAILSAAILALALLVISWMCLVALGVWLAVQAGAPVWLALTGAVLLNLTGVFACRLWYARLAPNVGFARTRRLLP